MGLPGEKIKVHAENYRRTVIALRDGTLDIEQQGRGNISTVISTKHYPHLKIAVNASDRSSAYQLMDLGITHK